MELFHIVQEVHYSYGTLACMVHVLKMGYRGRSHDHGMTGHMIKKCECVQIGKGKPVIPHDITASTVKYTFGSLKYAVT